MQVVVFLAALCLGSATQSNPITETTKGRNLFREGKFVDSNNAESVSDCPFKEELLEPKDGGSSYTGKVWVGYKFFRCLWDTGSFDLQVLSDKCTTCENTRELYHHESSKHFELLAKDSIVEIEYGSGPATVQKGFDRVGLFSTEEQGGRCIAQHTPFGEIIKTSIHELQVSDRRFEGVCGIAPGPEEKEKQRLIKRLGIDRVGFCFNQDTEKPGYARWNLDINNDGFHYSTNKNMGYYWAIRVNDFRLQKSDGQPDRLGCGTGSPCLGLMDTGTSLHSVDNRTLDLVYKHLNNIDDLSCDAQILKHLPSLYYTDDNGRDLHIDPEDYLVTMDDEKVGHQASFHDIPASVRKQLAFTPENLPQLLQKQDGKPQCILALADSGEEGMHIFGMPYFRHNQVVFDITKRTVSVAPHDGECRHPKSAFAETETRTTFNKINPYNLRPSRIAQRMQKAKKKGPHFVTRVKQEVGFAQLAV